MGTQDSTDYFEPIEVQDPADMIIQQIKDLISSGKLKPGERLPSEPKLEKSFKVSRAIVRRALKRLDAYGIVKVVPYSGTYVAGLGVEAFGGLFSNMLELEKKDYESLVEVRILLETYAVKAVAQNITPQGILELEAIQKDYSKQVKRGIISINEDLVFHIKIAEYTNNPILKTLIALLTSEVLKLFEDLKEKLGEKAVLKRISMGVQEHAKILDAIKAHDPEKAVQAMEEHYHQSKLFREQLE